MDKNKNVHNKIIKLFQDEFKNNKKLCCKSKRYYTVNDLKRIIVVK